jgi:hypothetical protein
MTRMVGYVLLLLARSLHASVARKHLLGNIADTANPDSKMRDLIIKKEMKNRQTCLSLQQSR